MDMGLAGDRLQQLIATSEFGDGNAAYLDRLYQDWLHDPNAVSASWQKWFRTLGGTDDVPRRDAAARIQRAQLQARTGFRLTDDTHARKQAAVLRLVTAYRSRGHLAAQLDPLGLAVQPPVPDLDLPFHGLSDLDLDTEFDCGSFAGGGQRLTLRTLRERLQQIYCRHVGAEFMHIRDAQQRRWVCERMERAGGNPGIDDATRLRVFDRLTAADGLERYLQTKYVAQKRFSLEGGDALIPLLDDLLRRAAGAGVSELVLGMNHRGRLNVLVNTLGKPPRRLFAEFEGTHATPVDPAHSGDVKYHLGFSADLAVPAGSIHVALAFNPSHLEIVNPVVEGSVRAREVRTGDQIGARFLPVLIHGDAGLAGQGVNMEVLNMSQTRGFGVGGTVHIVVNNQVGFTTDPVDARSTLYCTDMLKMVDAPVLHVNGDDPEAVLQCERLAFDFRQRFHKDVAIDLVCFRRHGHNEADEPSATQPRMYAVIKQHPATRLLYARELQRRGLVTDVDVQKRFNAYRDRLDAGEVVTELAPAGTRKPLVDWARFAGGKLSEPVATGVPRARLDALAAKILVQPARLTLHPRVAKIYATRRRMAAGQVPVDWGYAENLAYATLVDAGYPLRLEGQDTPRGAFFHRQAELHDQRTGEVYTPLAHVRDDVPVQVVDSLLSELAALAYEYGCSTADPDTLVVWEAQFGDFANGAQVVDDLFLSAGEVKWGRLSGLVLLLPHGYEGQGPEHSSARLERYLQLCALHNMQVCVPTTPAQMFHLLRRQMLRTCRKPLVVLTPKSLLRHKRAVSSLDDLERGHFHLVLPEARALVAADVRRLVLCTGKVYYDLLEAAEKRTITDVAIVRVEQLYPFPRTDVIAELAKYQNTAEVIWCQEEPRNQGAWFQIRHHLVACMGASHRRLDCVARPQSPAPATGYHDAHAAEQKLLVQRALAEPVAAPSGLDGP